MPSRASIRIRRSLARLSRLSRRRLVAGAGALVLLGAVVGWAVRPQSTSYRTTDYLITVPTGPGGTEPVTLDTTLYLPNGASARHRVPAVLLAHGFGGTKAVGRVRRRGASPTAGTRC